MRTRPVQILGLALVLWLAAIAPGEGRAEEEHPLDQARRLASAGRDVDAFRIWLAFPGAEHQAAALARTSKADLLGETATLLETTEDAASRGRIWLVRGDILLSRGEREAALASYREVAELLPRSPGAAWAWADVPAGIYPVEVPANRPHLSGQRMRSFDIGPGSHRDNWLLRRFIALAAWPEAEAELARIASFHRATAGTGPFSTVALQFAIDEAFYLKQRGDVAGALEHLLDPLLRIDLDRRPQLASRHRAGGASGRYGGISRKEYVRLAHGAFRTADRETELLAALEQQVDAGHRQALRVLARIHVQAGRLDRALELELAYIADGGFDPRSAAIRRGRVFEEAKRLRAAAAAYELALAAPPGPVDLPDPDEDERINAAPWAAMHMTTRRADRAPWRLDLFGRLERIYTALGRDDIALDFALRALDANPQALRRLERLEAGLERFRAGGKEREYRTWLATLVSESNLPTVRANAAWVLGDADAVVDHVLAAGETLREPELTGWMTRLQERDAGAYRALLEGLVASDPQSGRARFNLLRLTEGLAGDGTATLFEDLLEKRAEIAFDRPHGPWQAARLTGWGDVAYRLMRIYQRGGDDDAMLRLGLRIARGARPFRASDLRGHDHRSGNALPEQLAACLGLAIEGADEEALEQLDQALAASTWKGPRAQVARRRANAWPRGEGDEFGWANLPAALRLYACNEDVLCVAADASRIYAGHPWGVAIYERDGRPLTRVALGTSALSLAAGPDALWVGTPVGVHRIDRADFQVERLLGDQDLDPRRERDESARFSDHTAWAVALDGTRLWIGTRRDVRAYDTESHTLRLYAPDELAVDDRCDWERFFVDGEDLWVDGRRGSRRYDRRGDRWVAPTLEREQPVVHVLGRAAGVLWGDVQADKRLGHRPCRILLGPDGRTPRVEVLTLDPGLRNHAQLGREPWSLHGTWDGRPVFGAQGPAFWLDPETTTLRALPATSDGKNLARPLLDAVPEALQRALIRAHAGQGLRGESSSRTRRVGSTPFMATDWSLLRLDDGSVVLGGRSTRQRHIYPQEDWQPDAAHPREGSRDLGGLWLLSPSGEGRRISRGATADALPHNRALAATREAANADGRHLWIATPAGLAVLDRQLRVSATLGRREGLIADRFDDAAALSGRLYFGSGWDDCGGGLTVFDPATRVFTALLAADGLASDRVAGLTAEDDKLIVRYGMQYRRWARDYGYQRSPPTVYDTATGTFAPPGALLRYPRNDRPDPAPRPAETTPWLGGYTLSVLELGADGQHVLCSTHGLLIAPTAQVPAHHVPPLTVTLLADQPYQQRADAWRRDFSVHSPTALATALEDPNPYARVRALESAAHSDGIYAPWIEPLNGALEDEHLLVRRAAVALLAKIDAPEARPLLERAQDDPDLTVRETAALGVAEHGGVPDLRILERRLQLAGNSYYTSGLKFYDALAGSPTPEVVALLLRYPLPTDKYHPRLEVIAKLGRAVVDHPESIELLLNARAMRGTSYRADLFAQRVLAGGGKALLERLHTALRDPERVVRSNAARALGHIGEPASIPHLIAALQPESGLSRASAVWALGALRAREALPHLVPLYKDARADQDRRAGAGYRVGQASAEFRAAFESLASIASLSREWSELSAPAARPLDPLDEVLLTPAIILEAVSAIGTGAAQEFYRRSAAEPDRAIRCEAARQLANGDEAERDANLAVLRGLSVADDLHVRISATVSLWELARSNAHEEAILGWLSGSALDAQRVVLLELERVRDEDPLAPFRSALQDISADPYAEDHWRELAQKLLAR